MFEGVMPLKHETLQSQVHQQLCELILQGAFVPGESVTVARIAKALDVSPMPVREAISQLMALGALTVVSGRSVGVPRLGPAELADLRRVRIEVETTALRWAVAAADEVFIDRLAGILIEMEKAEETGRVKEFIYENYKFHFAIYQHAGSPLLLDIIATLWLRITPQFHLLQSSGHYRVSNCQHRDLLAAISSRDTEDAVVALKADIDSAYAVISMVIGESQ
ncbi:GntR family transcriptional regulator [Halomonas sp. AOP27-A1-41]|uniref:GntR family transcriptional regulator n=1 Tax=Halomonas sp. AOP27-A1-41 TaxID=3457707 RepID=UPI004033BB25